MIVKPWFKDLPDASIFNPVYKWMACDANGDWWVYADKPALGIAAWISCFCDAEIISELLHMPALDGDEWKYSLINLEDLEEWQVKNV